MPGVVEHVLRQVGLPSGFLDSFWMPVLGVQHQVQHQMQQQLRHQGGGAPCACPALLQAHVHCTCACVCGFASDCLSCLRCGHELRPKVEARGLPAVWEGPGSRGLLVSDESAGLPGPR